MTATATKASRPTRKRAHDPVSERHAALRQAALIYLAETHASFWGFQASIYSPDRAEKAADWLVGVIEKVLDHVPDQKETTGG